MFQRSNTTGNVAVISWENRRSLVEQQVVPQQANKVDRQRWKQNKRKASINKQEKAQDMSESLSTANREISPGMSPER